MIYEQLIFNPIDPVFQNNIDNRFQPIIGLGTFLYTDKWYIGLSTPNILSTDHFNNSSVSAASERAHIFLTGGYVFKLSKAWQFKPAFLARSVVGAPLGIDVSANFWFNERLTLGVAYRVSAAFSGIAGFQITDQLMIGYAYDEDTTDLGQFTNGSHEVFLRWELFKKKNKKVSPRFF